MNSYAELTLVGLAEASGKFSNSRILGARKTTR